MKLRISMVFTVVSTLVLCSILGAGTAVFGQGRGHGGNRDGDHQGGGPPRMPQGEGQRREQTFNPPPQRQQEWRRTEPVQVERQMPQRDQGWQNRGWQRQERAQQPRPQPQPNPGWQNRGWQRQEQNRAIRIERPRPQQNPVWQDRGWQRQERAQQPRPQPRENPAWQNRGWQRQGRQIEQTVPQRRPEFRSNVERTMPTPDVRARMDQESRRWRQDRPDRGEGRVANNELRQRERSEIQRMNAARIPPGLIRSQEVHERNDERRSLRDDQWGWRNDFRDHVWSDRGRREEDFDEHDRWDDDTRTFWRDNALRNVIANAFSGYSGSYYNYYPQYAPDYYGTPYNPTYFTGNYYGYPQYSPYYYGTPYNPLYYTANYYGYPQYSTYYGSPLLLSYLSPFLSNFFNSPNTSYYDPYYSNYYNPYNSNYYDPYYSNYYNPYNSNYYDPYYSGYYDPYYSSYSDPYYSSPYDRYDVSYYDPYNGYSTPYTYNYQPFGLYSQAGYLDPFDQYHYSGGDYCSLSNRSNAGNGLLGGTFGRLLASGYDQGYNDGLYARFNDFGDRYYYDPYVYDETTYAPYSYSLGTNRRCLSEGYELGYQDALYGRSQYNPLYGGNLDLVSLLAGSVLQTVNFAG